MKWIICLLLIACAHKNVKLDNRYTVIEKVSVDLNKFYNLVPKSIKIAQYVKFTKSNKTQQLQIVIVKDLDLQVSIMTMMGIEVANIKILKNGDVSIKSLVKSIDKILPKVIRDIIIIYTDLKSLKVKLKGIQIVDTKKSRVLNYNKNPIIKISYNNKMDWRNVVEFNNISENYKLSIKPLLFEKI